MKPAITALAPWFGSKRNLAGRIVEALGPHRAYWEPFCGSCAVLLTKPACLMETVNDLHGDLTNLARVVRDNRLAPALYRRLRRTWMAEDLFKEAAERVRSADAPEEPDLDRAADYMLTTWMGRNGVAGTESYNHHFCARYTLGGGHAAKRWTSVVMSIPAWHRRLREVTILRRDAFELLGKILDADRTALYVDPPYLLGTRSADAGFGRRAGSSLYVHDFSDDDHRKLAELLGRFTKARVVVSYYDHSLVDELYEGWTKSVIEVSKALAHQGRRGANDVKAREVLLVNQRPGGRLF